MNFIKKIREFDASLTMLFGVAIITTLFLFKTWSPNLNNHKDITTNNQIISDWQEIKADARDDLSNLLDKAGLNKHIVVDILKNNSYKDKLAVVKPAQTYHFKIINNNLNELLFPIATGRFLRIHYANNNYTTNEISGDIFAYINHKWLTITPKAGDTLSSIFAKAGLPNKTLYSVLTADNKKILAHINQRYPIHFKIIDNSLQVMLFPINTDKYLRVYKFENTFKSEIKLGKPMITNSLNAEVIAPQTKPVYNNGWLTIHPRKGDTLGRIFNRAGLTQKDLHNVLYKNRYAKQLAHININDDMRFNIQHNQLQEMIFSLDATKYLSIKKQGGSYTTQVINRPMTEKIAYVSAPVKGSLYTTAHNNGIPNRIIDQISQIFFWQVTLSREIKPGDRINIAYQTYYINNKLVKIGDVLAVSYQHPNGIKYEAIRHKFKNGQISYYSPNGSSLKKAFSRYPIRFSHISSNFGSSRKHPILHYNRPHKGIDLAAPIGTPIYSIGDGRISFIGRQNGYGNMVKINHAYSYTTVYAHMLRFQKGLRNGSYVQRGQIIGFVGQSGLATGPHCHYELHINHIPRNPASVALPVAQPIPAREKHVFLAHTQDLMHHLNLAKK